MADDQNVLKALVDEVLESNVHPDRRAVLEEWRENNLSDEEKEARLSDEEREERKREADATNRESENDKESSPATSERANEPDVTTTTETSTRTKKGR
jgi:hypothetical protein